MPLLVLSVAVLAANGVLRTTGVPFVSPARQSLVGKQRGLRPEGTGWVGRDVRPCSCPVADFQPAASATAKNPALTSWAKECRAVGPGTARFGQRLGKLPFKRLSGKLSGRRGRCN